ncbi:metalloregulator ArsR/SmtB family transcription factor [Nocardia sp. NPDC049220]|uniref:ArsR/SmtB family transcription factor n=1 Tax=Nocardia sp. NPDC049220 TaxID=3155273 RepID=UPI0033C8A142
MGEPKPTGESPVRRARDALADIEIRAWSRRFDLLSDPNRLEILLCLHRSPGITVGEIAEAVGRSENAISQALSVLRRENCVTSERAGRAVTNRLSDQTIHDVLHIIGARHR